MKRLCGSVFFLVLLFTAFSCLGQADSSKQDPRMAEPSAVIKSKERVISVNSELLDWMNEKLAKLFESGLPLRLVFEAAIFEDRPFWLDTQIASVTVRKQVSYDPIKKCYTITVLQSRKEKTTSFGDKQEAMMNLLNLSAEIPLPLMMEMYPKRVYYAGVSCEVKASKMVFPLGHLLWFMRAGYTTDWAYSKKVSTKVLQGDGSKKKSSLNTPEEMRRRLIGGVR